MAAERVSETTELLEAIMLYLPAKDTLMAKAVSQRWQRLIESSTYLQRATYTIANGDVIRLSPQIYEADEQFRLPLPMLPSLETQDHECNPIFRQTERDHDLQGIGPWSTWVDKRNDCTSISYLHGFSMKIDVGAEKPIQAPDACRPMFLRQPPVTAVHLWTRGVGTTPVTILDKQGVALGCIEHKLQSIIKQVPGGVQTRSSSKDLVPAGFTMMKPR